MLNLNHKAKRDLLTGMDYVRDNSLVTQREYNYDALGRPTTRDTRYPDRAVHHVDAFAYNKRSELTGALLDGNAYTYAYDNIGNREITQEAAEDITYDANDLNQYTRISTNGEDFTPEYDADGNQTLVQTTTGIWHVTYNAQNRAVRFESEDGRTVITCGYDYMGRRFEKKVTVDGAVTLHERYIYRGYLQIAAFDMLHGAALIHSITWEPSQEIATRPLAIRENGVWYTYGWDLTKNICELYGQEGFICTIYRYSPYGIVTAEGDATQCIQWSSEMYDAELGIVYYNFRYYNSLDGRWTRRDPMKKAVRNLYEVSNHNTMGYFDYLGQELLPFSQNDLTEIPLGWKVVYDGSYRILGDTRPIWPDPLGSCRACLLKLDKDAKLLIEMRLYNNKGFEQWRDNFGNDRVQHEYVHVAMIAAVWDAFVQRANTYEKKYPTTAKCQEQFEKIVEVYSALKQSVNRENKEFDSRAY